MCLGDGGSAWLVVRTAARTRRVKAA